MFYLSIRGLLYKRFLFFWKQKIPEYNLVKHEGLVLMMLYVMYIVYIKDNFPGKTLWRLNTYFLHLRIANTLKNH